jgi:Sel1 repeat
MRHIPNFRSIAPIRPLRPGFRSTISRGLKQAVVVAACCCAVLADLHPAIADPASDRNMANRFEQAAQAGDDDAQFNLGALYASGVGRQRSDEEAFNWFLRAANQGHSHGMLIVAGLYASGRGIAKDNVKAYTWAYIVSSASQVDEYRNGARQLMSLLMNRMTSDEIGRAVVAARAWRAVRVANKAPDIERAAESPTYQLDPAAPAPAAVQPAPAAVQPAPVAVQPASVAVQPAPAATTAPAVAQPAPSKITALPAPSNAASAPPAKNAKRDDVRDLVDQVPSGLRKRFGF